MSQNLNNPSVHTETDKKTPEAAKVENPMPADHPQKQSLFASLADKLRDLSNSVKNFLGLGEKPNGMQLFLANLVANLNGIDIYKGVTIKSESDIAKVKEAFRSIVDFSDSAVTFEVGDFVQFNVQKGEVDIYSADAKSKTGHSETVRDTIAIPNSRTIDNEPAIEDKEFEEGGRYYDETIRNNADSYSSKVGQALGDWLVKNGPSAKRGKGGCARFCRYHLENSFHFQNPPRGNGNQWAGLMEKDSRFKKIEIKSLDEIPVGGIMTYDGRGTNARGMNKKYGHVEIKGADGRFYSDYASPRPGGGAKAPNLHNDFEKWKKATGFSGVYLPIALKKSDVNAAVAAGEGAMKKSQEAQSAENAKNELLPTSKEINERGGEFIQKQLEVLRKKGLNKGDQAIIVSAEEQKAYLTKEDGTIIKVYPVSTAKNGIGNAK